MKNKIQSQTLEGRILTPHGWIDGRISFNASILEIKGVALSNDTNPIEASVPLIMPGFIDVHVHGGAGFDTMDGANGVLGMAQFHAQHGTTALLATTITNPWDQVCAALVGIRAAMNAPEITGARILGAHLEGPFINPNRLGAQPAHTVIPTPERVQQILQSGTIQVVTIAPEIEHAQDAIQAFIHAGLRISLGHTNANWDQANSALEFIQKHSGVSSGTHLFNAMSGLSARAPGVIGAILTNPAAWTEIILDGHHVHSSNFQLAFNAKPKQLILITDAMRATGLPGDTSELGGQIVTIQNGMATLTNGTLAGSILTMDRAVQNAIKAGLSLKHAVDLASKHPAQYLGLSQKGQLEPERDADIIVMNSSLEVQQVHVEGQEIF